MPLNFPSGNSIGDPIIGGTAGSVLFIDASGNLGQDNVNLNWDDAGNKLKVNILGILEGGASPTKYTYFQGGDQTVDITYTLPTALPASNKVLQSTSGGILSWETVSTSPGGADTQVQYNAAGAFGGSANWTVDTTDFKIVQTATLDNATGNEVAYQLNYTTNKLTSGNDTGLLISMTDTTSPGTSLPLDIQVGLVSKFSVNNSGNVSSANIFNGVYYGTTGTASATITGKYTATSTGNHVIITPENAKTNTSGSSAILAITPTYNQASGTAANTDLLINRTQTAVGSGAQLLIDAQTGSTTQFKVSNTGYGYLLNKLNINGADSTGLQQLEVFSAVNQTGTERIVSMRNTTATWVPAIHSVSQTSADMADGFGAGIKFLIRDAAAVDNPIGIIGAERAGADTTSNLIFQAYSAGTAKTLLTLGAAASTPAATITGFQDVPQLRITANSTQTNSTSPLMLLEASDGTDIGAFSADGVTTVFIGVNAGRVNTPGGGLGNVFLGNECGYSTTTGDYNFASGYQALYSNITASYNMFIGSQAGYYVTGSSNVGVGANSARGGTGSGNVGIGDAALYPNANYTGNTAIGYNALNAQTGNYAVAIGYTAGYTNTAADNIFIGTQAGYANTSGGLSVYIGRDAGRYTVTGAANTMIGYNAGYGVSANTYAGVTAMGYKALFSLTTGDYATAFGYAAGYTNTAQNNVFIGTQAGYSNTSGTQNIFIGRDAGQYTVTGAGNTVIGYTAGQGVSTNSYSNNTLIGNVAGKALTTGGQNVLIGSSAGDALTTGGGNIIIGYNIDATAATTSNELNIGGIIKGDLSTGSLTLTSTQFVDTIGITIDGGGSAITTGLKGFIEVPYACTIQQVTMLADQSGSCVVDIWKDTYANFPPTVADTITASAKPTITTATKSQDATLTGWTTTVAAGAILAFNVDSAATITRLNLILKVLKT